MVLESHGSGSRFQDRWEVVASRLRELILNGEIAPGERLLETELAERFEVSRGPIREAIRSLETSGLVIRVPRQGSYVTPIEIADVEEIYSLRERIECFAIERAMNRSVSLQGRVAGAAEQMRSLAGRAAPSDVVDADLAFHTEFYEEARHSRLMHVWQGLRDPLRILILITSQRTEEDWEVTLRGHDRIVEAVRQGSVEDAVLATRDHLTIAHDRVAELLRSRS